ncbi:MAG TPA: hypothetical protein VFY04_05830 [Solirubrobacterales bacterium]|nr:hypothetical protein [Solirubrobacterales bacterium]
MKVDLNRLASAAAESYFQARGPSHDAEENGRDSRLGGLGGVALGVGLAVTARALYNRARRFDLERVAGAVEDRLSR